MVFVIAEAGVNHNGNASMARELVVAAANAGADAVKFQTFSAARLAAPSVAKAEYQVVTTGGAESQYEMLKALELDRDAHFELKAEAQRCGIEFMSTGFDVESLGFLLDDVGIERIKIPSGDITNGPLIYNAVKSGLPLIVSTGMSNMEEIADAVDLIAYALVELSPPSGRADFKGYAQKPEVRDVLNSGLTLLQCTTNYPTQLADANVLMMRNLAERFRVPVGFSDHTMGTTAAAAAVALGAMVVEKHFTLSRSLPGPDQAASLEPAELSKFVESLRDTETALGSFEKHALSSERDMHSVVRQSLVAVCDIEKGAIIGHDDLTISRAAPVLVECLIGRSLVIRQNAPLKLGI